MKISLNESKKKRRLAAMHYDLMPELKNKFRRTLEKRDKDLWRSRADYETRPGRILKPSEEGYVKFINSDTDKYGEDIKKYEAYKAELGRNMQARIELDKARWHAKGSGVRVDPKRHAELKRNTGGDLPTTELSEAIPTLAESAKLDGTPVSKASPEQIAELKKKVKDIEGVSDEAMKRTPISKASPEQIKYLRKRVSDAGKPDGEPSGPLHESDEVLYVLVKK